MGKIVVAVGLVLGLAIPAKACPPNQFGQFAFANQFALSQAFNPCISFDAIDVPSIQLVPQIVMQRQFVPRLSFPPQQFSFPVNPCASQFVGLSQFATSPYGSIGGANFGNFNFGNRGAAFSGRNFEFNGNLGRNFNFRESPRGGVRLRSRGN